MNRTELIRQIKQKQSFLCIGLDTDPSKIPAHLRKRKDPVFEFNKAIIDATSDMCVAYKPNIAFYESLGPAGWESLAKTLEYIPDNLFIIADAKRGDIGNTSSMYARTFYEQYHFDAVTVAPYMGRDSVSPFLEFENKWVILLALTSNEGASDFQMDLLANGEKVFEKVIRTSQTWGNEGNMMYVVGATRGESFKQVRKIAPGHFLLVPGIGAQGGSLQEVCEYGLNKDIGLLVNASRTVLYASSDENFADESRREAMKIRDNMKQLLLSKHLI